jgi:hypothetical protein
MKNLQVLPFFIIFIAMAGGCNVPEFVSVKKDVPIEVHVDDTFNFTVTVDNADTKKHELRSIDIDNTFLEGIYIVSTTPATSEEYGAFGQHIFEFKTFVPESSLQEVVFTAKAIKSGDFSGDLDICIDGDASCLFNSIRILVN